MNKIILFTLLSVFFMAPACLPADCSNVGADWTCANASAPFSPRHEQGTLVFNNRMWLLGGAGPSFPHYSDVYSTSDGVTWTLETSNAGFGQRGAAGYVVYDNGTGSKMWIIGGEKNAVWQKDVLCSSNGVDWVTVTGNAAFGVRECHSSLVFNGNMWMIGGYNNNMMNDVWYSTNGADWYMATGNAGFTVRTYSAAAVYNGKMWIIGGGVWGGTTGLPDVWCSSDGVNWTMVTNTFRPKYQARAEVFDGKLWVIGGFENGTRVNDAWYTTDGVNWAQATSAAQFCGRSDGTTAVYDNRMWYIAGSVSGGYVNDVWYTGCPGGTPVPTRTIAPTQTATSTATPLPQATLTPTGTPPVTVVTPEPHPTVEEGGSTAYPTVAKDTLKIVFNINKKCDVKMYVYTFAGELVDVKDYSIGETPNDKTYKIQLDVRGYANGTYYYVIQGRDVDGQPVNFKSRKFMVKR